LPHIPQCIALLWRSAQLAPQRASPRIHVGESIDTSVASATSIERPSSADESIASAASIAVIAASPSSKGAASSASALIVLEDASPSAPSALFVGLSLAVGVSVLASSCGIFTQAPNCRKKSAVNAVKN
jgi:hypothetical protein